jgi:hypothetical protein
LGCQVCNAFTIKFPIDHLIVGAVELSKEAVTYAFGACLCLSCVHSHAAQLWF